MLYQRDEEGVRGFRIEDEIVCPDCIEEEEIEEMNKGRGCDEDEKERRMVKVWVEMEYTGEGIIGMVKQLRLNGS